MPESETLSEAIRRWSQEYPYRASAFNANREHYQDYLDHGATLDQVEEVIRIMGPNGVAMLQADLETLKKSGAFVKNSTEAPRRYRMVGGRLQRIA